MRNYIVIVTGYTRSKKSSPLGKITVSRVGSLKRLRAQGSPGSGLFLLDRRTSLFLASSSPPLYSLGLWSLTSTYVTPRKGYGIRRSVLFQAQRLPMVLKYTAPPFSLVLSSSP